MQYGYFDDSAKEYVITNPKTPLPWINYLGTDGFFSLVSNTSGGYSFYKDAKLLRLTRYRYNDCPLDSNGHFTISKITIRSGIPAGNQRRRHWMITAAAMDLDIVFLHQKKTALQPNRKSLSLFPTRAN